MFSSLFVDCLEACTFSFTLIVLWKYPCIAVDSSVNLRYRIFIWSRNKMDSKSWHFCCSMRVLETLLTKFDHCLVNSMTNSASNLSNVLLARRVRCHLTSTTISRINAWHCYLKCLPVAHRWRLKCLVKNTHSSLNATFVSMMPFWQALAQLLQTHRLFCKLQSKGSIN